MPLSIYNFSENLFKMVRLTIGRNEMLTLQGRTTSNIVLDLNLPFEIDNNNKI